MPNQFEKIPPARANLQFPGGDARSDDAQRASQLFDELISGTSDEQLKKLRNLRSAETSHWKSMSGQGVVAANLQHLADSWGASYESAGERAQQLAAIGMFSTLAFIKKSRLLPVVNLGPFTEELQQMSSYGPDDIQVFAEEAWWGSKQVHPVAHGVLEPWVMYLADTFGIEQSLNPGLLEATTALPYVLASATRMNGYFTRYTDREIGRLITGSSAPKP